MNYTFFKSFYEKLIENEFRLIDGFFDKAEIDENSCYFGVYKYIGNFVYCLTVVNENACDGKYREYVDDLRAKVKHIFEKINITNMISLNIIISENISDDIVGYINQFGFDIENEYNELCWCVDCFDKKIVTAENVPDKILDIHKIVSDTFSFIENTDNKGITSVDNSNFYQIAEDVKIKNQKSLKSQNSTVTFILLIINVLVFATMELNGGSENYENLIKFGAVSSELVFQNGQFFRIFTDMFVHIGFAHIASNALSLYILGSRSEKYFGSPLFLFIYLVSGVGASLASVIFTDGLSAGASGAIFGIMGAMLINSFITKKSIGDFSGYFMAIFSLINIGTGFIMTGVDNAGHIGGFLTGAIISLIYTIMEKNKIKKMGK